MKRFLIPMLLLLGSCQWVERRINWAEYTDEAAERDLIPIHPEELYPEDPELGYFDNSPMVAGDVIEEDEREDLEEAMQQAAYIKVKMVRAASDDVCDKETTTTVTKPIAVTPKLRELFKRWETAPEWMQLTPCGMEEIGELQAENHFIFVDADGDELDCFVIYAAGAVCKPQGQKHYDRMCPLLFDALGIEP